MGRAYDKNWCILRTSAARTLKLARSLGDAGFDVWTPTETKTVRVGRHRERRERPAPIAPTFVFARADRLADLVRARSLPGSPHPAFSIFRHAGRVPLIADRDIAALHVAEDRAAAAAERARRKAQASQHPVFAVGERVQVKQPAFAGMTGVVEEAGKAPVINLGGTISMRIDAWLLVSDAVQSANTQPHGMRQRVAEHCD